MKLLTIVAIILLVFFLAPADAYSCECQVNGDGTPKSSLRHAKAVFLGEVLEIREATAAERETYSNLQVLYIVRMRVERYWKGIKSREVIVLPDTTGCGPKLRLGEKYLVYGMGKYLYTGCTRTCILDRAEEDLKALGPGKQFDDK